MAKWAEVYRRGARTQSASSTLRSACRVCPLDSPSICALSIAMLAATTLVGCGPRRHGSDAGSTPDFGLGDVPASTPDRRLCMDSEDLPFVPVPVNLLVLFDRS